MYKLCACIIAHTWIAMLQDDDYVYVFDIGKCAHKVFAAVRTYLAGSGQPTYFFFHSIHILNTQTWECKTLPARIPRTVRQ